MLNKIFLGLLFISSFNLIAGKNGNNAGFASSRAGVVLFGTGNERAKARYFAQQEKKHKKQTKSTRAYGSCCTRLFKILFGR